MGRIDLGGFGSLNPLEREESAGRGDSCVALGGVHSQISGRTTMLVRPHLSMAHFLQAKTVFTNKQRSGS